MKDWQKAIIEHAAQIQTIGFNLSAGRIVARNKTYGHIEALRTIQGPKYPRDNPSSRKDIEQETKKTVARKLIEIAELCKWDKTQIVIAKPNNDFDLWLVVKPQHISGSSLAIIESALRRNQFFL